MTTQTTDNECDAPLLLTNSRREVLEMVFVRYFKESLLPRRLPNADVSHIETLEDVMELLKSTDPKD